MSVLAVIPSRYASTRLPGKPLAPILGRPMIEWVYAGTLASSRVDRVIVATDDERIIDAVHAFGGEAEVTSSEHRSGTDRVAEIAARHPADIVLNVQGDEPLVSGDIIDAVVAALDDARADISTPITPLAAEHVNDPGIVKVVRDVAGFAMYFSRAAIPFVREAGAKLSYLKHVGIYGYRAESLARFVRLAPSELELAESLEQLRALQAGFRIKTVAVAANLVAVDYPADLASVEAEVHRRSLSLPKLTAAAARHGATPPPPRSRSMRECLRAVRLIVTDCDGVLTNGQLVYDDAGRELKSFNVRDGYAVAMLKEAGVHVAIVSGRDSGALRARAHELGIELVKFGVSDKAAAARDLILQCGAAAAQVLCVGDDVPDLPMFEAAGVSAAPADACRAVKARVDVVCVAAGGDGVLRELAERILEA